VTTHELGQQVLDLIGTPKDEWEIAAQLEVMGLRDADARTDFGARDLFDLARHIYTRFQEGVLRVALEPEDPPPDESALARFARNYVTGLTFSLPMALQAAAMLLWGYGVWGAIEMDLRTGSAIALGFIGSYIATGGFMQAIVRRGLFYIYQQEEWLARWAVLRSWGLALRIVLALLLPALALNAIFQALPWSIVLTAAGYYAGLSILWLNWSLIYLVKQTWLFLLTIAIALAAVLAAAKLFGATPVAANVVGLVVADVVSFALAIRGLNRLAKTRAAKSVVNPPRLTVLVFSTSRFFVYGLLYNTFLFADRVIAWTSSTGREDFPPYGFWLNVRYELGMDLALVVVMILAGVVEHAAQRFSEELIPMEKRVKSVASEPFLAEVRNEQRRRAIVLAIGSVVAVALAIVVMLLLRGMPSLPIYSSLIAPTTTRVFIVATLAYVVFLFALQNVLMLLTLSRVELVVRAVAIALVVNVAVGFIFSRAVHYSWAVAGLLAGATVLLVLTARAMRKVTASLDYYYYAAY
jgi:hypothetical protein